MYYPPYFLRFLLLAAGLSLGGCDKQPTDPSGQMAEATPQKISGIEESGMDKAVRPGDDFNRFANGTWLDSTEIPPDKNVIGSFRTLHDQSEAQIQAIIQDISEHTQAAGSDEQKVGDMYRSYMNMEIRNQAGISPLTEDFASIDAIENTKDLASYFATALQAGIRPVITAYVAADLKAPENHTFYIHQGRLGLPDREYYLKDDSKYADIRKQYIAHLDAMLQLADIENPSGDAAQRIMALETQLAQAHMAKEERRDPVKNYNPHSYDALTELMPAFDWAAYFTAAKTGILEKVIVGQVDYLRQLNKLIDQTQLEDWKLLLKWTLLNNYANYLSEALDNQDFAFYGTVMQGTTEQRERWRRGVSSVNYNIGELVGKIYVKRHFSPEAKARMLVLVNHLLKAYEVSINDLSWMGDETKKAAIQKLKNFTVKIGYPDKWKDYSGLSIQPDYLF
ncbi:MAG: M13 family metallopeptidase, partial [Gammaproteobacteria bacterium]|nr:M13 family metallopeptidase [Gammaproteobacteria bacterium]